MLIRTATQDDNDKLVELAARCPQGTSLVVRLDRSPDYFARTHPYDRSETYVADDNGTIAAVVQTSLKPVNIGGESVLSAYQYSVAVSPDYRRQRLGYRVAQHCQEDDQQQGAKFAQAWILSDNKPSLGLFKKMGYRVHKSVHIYAYLPRIRHKPKSGTRRATAADYPAIVDVLNDCYREYDFYRPFTVERLQEYLKRLPGFSLDDIYVYEKAGEIVSVLACWDYHYVAQGTIIKLNTSLNLVSKVTGFFGQIMAMPRVPQLHKNWAYTVPVLLGYRNSTDEVEKLWPYINNFTIDKQANVIMLPYDPDTALSRIKGLGLRVRVDLELVVKEYGGYQLPPSKYVYADPIDA